MHDGDCTLLAQTAEQSSGLFFLGGGMDVYGRGWSYAPLQGRQPGGERRSCRGLLQAVAPEERQESFDVA